MFHIIEKTCRITLDLVIFWSIFCGKMKKNNEKLHEILFLFDGAKKD